MKTRLSLSAKILALAFLNLLLLGVTLVSLAGVQLQNFNSFLLAPTRNRILAEARLMALELTQTPIDQRDQLLERHARARGVKFYLFDNLGSEVAGERLLLPPVVHGRLRQGDFSELFSITTHSPTRYWLCARIPIGAPGAEEPRPGTLILMSESLLGNTFFLDITMLGVVLLGFVTISAAFWLPLIRGLSRSLSQITEAAEQIAMGQFDVQVSADRRDQLGQLAVAVNRMAKRLTGFVQGQKRFLGDIAHELCSPIARVQFALGALEQQVGDPQLELVKDVREDVDHMFNLVAELLSFSKAGMRPVEAEHVPVNVAETVRRAMARESSVEARIEVCIDEELRVLADPEYLFRALSNLIRNSVRYAASDGPIQIAAESRPDGVLIMVADSGPGLPEEAFDQLFTPFHRLEPARTREKGGAGLGLAIVKSCIEACKGTVQCRNRHPRGLTVEILLAAA